VSGDDNPYRFTGGEAEAIASALAERRRLTLRDLRGISRCRRILAALLELFGASCLATLISIAVTPAGYAPPRGAADYYAFTMGAIAAAWTAAVGMVLVGAILDRLVGGRFGGMLTIGLLFPGLNAISAVMLLISAGRTLVSRNVRLGWLKDDFSQADFLRADARPIVETSPE
jgi:hypothetical protein